MTNEAFGMAVFWYALGAYPRLAGMTEQQKAVLRKAVVDFTVEHSHYEEVTSELPGWDSKVTLTHAVAIGAALLVEHQMQLGNELPNSPILQRAKEAWDLYQRGERVKEGEHGPEVRSSHRGP